MKEKKFQEKADKKRISWWNSAANWQW